MMAFFVGGLGLIMPFNGAWLKIHKTAFIAPSAFVVGDVKIGRDSSIWFGCTLRGDVNSIRVGERVSIQDNSVLHSSNDPGRTVVGDNVVVGHGAIVHACRVGSDSLVGIGSIVLDNAVIGKGSFIAAGSLVLPGTRIPPKSFVVGSPAKVLKEVEKEKTNYIAWDVRHYVELKNKYLKELV